MEVWAWLLAYVLGFALLQLVLYRYFSREQGALDGATPGGTEATGRPVGESGAGAGEGRLRCQHCGATNKHDPQFTYCKQCASPLR